MDRVVRVFSGGIVNEDNSFSKMKEQYARFETPQSFEELVARVRVLMNVDSNEGELSLRGRVDSGKTRAHYMLYPTPNEDEWKFYNLLVKSPNCLVPRCLSIYVGTD